MVNIYNNCKGTYKCVVVLKCPCRLGKKYERNQKACDLHESFVFPSHTRPAAVWVEGRYGVCSACVRTAKRSCCSPAAGAGPLSKNLVSQLFSDYDPTVMPITNASEAITVTMGLTLHSILDVVSPDVTRVAAENTCESSAVLRISDRFTTAGNDRVRT